MCVVSNIGDNYKGSFPDRWPNINPWVQPPYTSPINPPQVSKEEFEALKKEVQELKELLKAAKIYDENTGQPDCEMDEKVEFIKKIAEFVGVDMDEIFRKTGK